MVSINKKKEALLEKYSQEKLRNLAMKRGVTLNSPETVFISKDTKFGKNVTIHPYVVIGWKVKISNNVEILSFTHIENAKIESNVSVGPFSRIRPGAHLQKGSKVGNFVEIKKSKVGKNSKISHLSYVGDTVIGKNVNIGAGVKLSNVRNDRRNILVSINNEKRIDTGLRKFGALIGDGCEIGCNVVSNPGTILEPGTMISPNETLNGWVKRWLSS